MNFYTSDHPLLTFVIGLPGSGKSTLFNHIESNPFIDFKIYDDWLVTYKNNCGLGSFNCDTRYEELVDHLKSGRNCVVSCIKFTDSEFLESSKLHFTSNFEGVLPNLLYFENNPENCIINVKLRDINNVGHWKYNDTKELWYYGTVFNNSPLYMDEINKINYLSEGYFIPTNYPTIKINTLYCTDDLPMGY